jgi:hypothetical protein
MKSINNLTEILKIQPVGSKWKQVHAGNIQTAGFNILDSIHQELFGQIGLESDPEYQLEQSYNEFI